MNAASTSYQIGTAGVMIVLVALVAMWRRGGVGLVCVLLGAAVASATMSPLAEDATLVAAEAGRSTMTGPALFGALAGLMVSFVVGSRRA